MELAHFERLRMAAGNAREAKKYVDHNGKRVWHQARPNKHLKYPGIAHATLDGGPSGCLGRPRQLPPGDPAQPRDTARTCSTYATSKFADTSRSDLSTTRTARARRFETTSGAEWTKVISGKEGTQPRLRWRETSTVPFILKHPLANKTTFAGQHGCAATGAEFKGGRQGGNQEPPTRLLAFNNAKTSHWSRVLRGQKY